MQTYELCSDMIDVVIDISQIYGNSSSVNNNQTGHSAVHTAHHQLDSSKSASIIKLSNGSVLYLREVNKHLVLVCKLRQNAFKKSGLIEYNFKQFKLAISQLFEAKEKFKQEQDTK